MRYWTGYRQKEEASKTTKYMAAESRARFEVVQNQQMERKDERLITIERYM